MPMGVLAPRSANADPPLSPPSTWAEIFRHKFLQSRRQIVWKNLKKTKNHPLGARGGGQFLIYPNFYLYQLGAHAKIWNNTTTPSVVLNNGGPNT